MLDRADHRDDACVVEVVGGEFEGDEVAGSERGTG